MGQLRQGPADDFSSLSKELLIQVPLEGLIQAGDKDGINRYIKSGFLNYVRVDAPNNVFFGFLSQ